MKASVLLGVVPLATSRLRHQKRPDLSGSLMTLIHDRRITRWEEADRPSPRNLHGRAAREC